MEEKVGGLGIYILLKGGGGSPVFHQQKGDAHKLHQSSLHNLVDFHHKTYARY